MRDIKFRAWDESTKIMHYPASDMMWDVAHIIKSFEPIMQYTGLKDKNGKEIYEGDVVRILYTDWASKAESDSRTLEQYLIDIAHVMIVIWSHNGFYVSNKINGYADSIEPGTHGYIEIIGNIYSNPELLNV